MTEREALRRQAQGDFAVFELLRAQDRDVVPESHPLHYLQMATEKLAKAVMLGLNVQFDRYSHVAFSRLPQVLKRPDMARRLGYANHKAYLESLKNARAIFREVEESSPAVGPQQLGGGPTEGPNTEYPWEARDRVGVMQWHVPVEHDFGLLSKLHTSAPGRDTMRFIRDLLDRFEGLFG